jgi:GT2 family glycosyltransferase
VTDLAIIIVNWNVRELLAACLNTVQADLAGSGLSGQIWVVDNASTDGSAELVRRQFPEVRLIASDQNLGFAAGNNAALRAIGFPAGLPAQLPEAVLLLNPDTEIHPGALKTLLQFLQNTPQAGVAGARLVYGNGSFQHSGFDFPGLWQLAIELLPLPGRLVESRLNGRYPPARYEQGRPFQVGHPLGAAMCVRAQAIRQVGLLDEGYHMYVEEIDWVWRITSAGWAAYCVPTALVTHLGGQSTAQTRTTSFVNLWASRYRFYRKHYAPLKVWLAAQIVRLGMHRRARQDAAAAGRAELSPAELSERQRAYEHVAKIWRQRASDD